jgi:deoxycytidine triphosphate deaminase
VGKVWKTNRAGAAPRIAPVVLSDRTIARLLAEGRIQIEPYDDSLLQPSSVDVRVDKYFRVFHNNRYPYIDVREEQEDLTELVEVEDETPFVLHPGEFVLGSTLERVRLPDDLVARLEGKALALDTPVPTTQGWRTMADLEPGDLVLDEDGFPTVVLAATPPLTDRECFEIRFSDGTTVVADAEHQWRTIARNDREYALQVDRVVTTRQIADTLRVRGEVNHHVRLATEPSNLDGAETASAVLVGVGSVVEKPPYRVRPKTRARSHDCLGIVDVREVQAVPVRCIEVSSPRGLFLITKSFIPTHNSSLGRLGLLIHSTAGYIDPGWDGHVTLELSNVANLPVTIYPGMKIGQISFVQLSEPAETPYGTGQIGSKYQGQRGPTPSRYWQNFQRETRG